LNTKGLSGHPSKTLSLRRLARCSAYAIALLALGGCGDVAKPVVGPITFFANASGTMQLPPVTSVTHSPQTQLNLDVTVTGDPEALGVDWTVTCGSSLPEGSLPAGQVDTSCGSFAPYHTVSGPLPSYTLPAGTVIVTTYTAPSNVPKGGTVTIIAHATSLPSSVSSVTLTVM
jgi:hypothetical protein